MYKNIISTLKKIILIQVNWWLLYLTLVTLVLHFISLIPILGIREFENIPLFLTIALGGFCLIYQVFLKLVHRSFGADFLAIIALIVGVILGEYLAAVLIILMLTGGQVLESYAMRKASSALRSLADRMPITAHRKIGDQIDDISVDAILIGETIVIFPHETAPVDGVVISGHGSMYESYLTGEPYHLAKTQGSAVLSGAINGEAVLVIKAEKLSQQSRYAQIMSVMQDAEQKRPNMRRLGDQFGAIFAPIVLLFALAVWYFTGESLRFLAVLVVATPCPLLIGIPITIISAISIAAKQGIIIKDPVALERLPTCRTAIFDKTGTLTYGRPELTEMISASKADEAQILQATASLERYSKHPLANAIIQAAENCKLELLNATSVSEKPGQGLVGTINGDQITVTHRKKLLQDNPDMNVLFPPTAPGLECIILKNGAYAATFQFRDAPRADGKSFIGHLGPLHHFKKIMLVSGDRESEVTYLANILGIKNTLSSQTPEQKVEIVRAEDLLAPTLFMGDGINDAPALASATVGIAFGQHSSVTAEAAGVVILENSLAKVDELLHISISMRKIVLQSVIGGMVLSIVAMGFAAGGHVTPVMGALLQEGIDILAITNALRLVWSRKINTDFNLMS